MSISLLAVSFWVWAMIPAMVYAACNADITATAPDSRYTDHGNGTVTDRITGLMWKQCSEGQSSIASPCDTGSTATYTWQQALQQAETINSDGGFAGSTDWRLPNRNELNSLLERQCFSPAINSNLFPNTGSVYYWTSSPYASRSTATFKNYAWRVHLGSGQIPRGSLSSTYRARLVRGGF